VTCLSDDCLAGAASWNWNKGSTSFSHKDANLFFNSIWARDGGRIQIPSKSFVPPLEDNIVPGTAMCDGDDY